MFIVQRVLFELFSSFLELLPLLIHKYFQRHSEREEVTRLEHGASELCFGRQCLVSGLLLETLESF